MERNWNGTEKERKRNKRQEARSIWKGAGMTILES